jgi:hypothetical protein
VAAALLVVVLACQHHAPAPGVAALAARGAPVQAGSRLVAIGDVHGALGPFVAILQRAAIADANRHWTGAGATFVQTGDYLDRGQDVRAVLDLLMALEREGRAAGGHVEILLGNHEVMNLVGELRDVNPDIYPTFADGGSRARREAAWKAYDALAKARADTKSDAAVYRQAREQWMAAHPMGWLEYRDALGPSGRYGQWLRKKFAGVVVGGAAFMHAGINPHTAPTGRVDDVNAQVRADIARVDALRDRLVRAKRALPSFTLNELLQVAAAEVRAANAAIGAAKATGTTPDLGGMDVDLLRECDAFLKIGDWTVLAPDGPMWYRGYATEADEALAAPLAALLTRNEATRLVVAHTPQADGRVRMRLDGRLFVIDTGMLASVYRGRPSALEIANGSVSAIYEDGVVPLAVR